MQEIIKDPRHEEHADMMEWFGLDDPKDFDQRDFDPKEVEFVNPKKRLVEWNRGLGLRRPSPKS